ncbi:hypothetical protein [Iamia sp.]|jgi:hypothetical protein|uniref:hypothetical protein n=1 Tax=Iamia sp. TaxID=2722710 RepID=UPI002BC592C5|nr:hypothetical protein [Iamia sp.]HXH55766.1 hypothetical protein [Iamia sp.]
MKIEAHGIRAELPSGWEGRITRRRAGAATGNRRGTTTMAVEDTGPVLHMANFALPEDRGDFGSGAVDVMGSGHLLVVVVEYGTDSVGTALFPEVPQVPRLTARMFSSQALQRIQRGQAGAQRFFTLNGRAFCLYSVVGDQRDATPLARSVNDVTAQIQVATR